MKKKKYWLQTSLLMKKKKKFRHQKTHKNKTINMIFLKNYVIILLFFLEKPRECFAKLCK